MIMFDRQKSNDVANDILMGHKTSYLLDNC